MSNTEQQDFIIEHALNLGAEVLDDDATVFKMTEAQILELVQSRQSKPEDFDYDHIMTCPYRIRDVGLRHLLFVVETKPECVALSPCMEASDTSIAFFKCHSLEHARHVLRREWFKRIHKAITEGEKP